MHDPNAAPDTSKSAPTVKPKKQHKAKPKPRREPSRKVPAKGTDARKLYQYACAFARGMYLGSSDEPSRRTPFAVPMIKGWRDALPAAMIMHGRDGDGKILRGAASFRWMRDTAREFRSSADPASIDFRGGWTPGGFSRWLNSGRPSTRGARQSGAAHIQVRRA